MDRNCETAPPHQKVLLQFPHCSLCCSIPATALLYCRGCPHCADTANTSIPSKEHKTAWATVYSWCCLRSQPQC
ncbi:hypothetical protein COCON_G00144150 [Conger conger]|uniref:Uncharacterized protein n=1 Tax=Conger conger TaxID=82655 RepID=A0A9Q1DBD2_CONCO|nr:hypothetical protein COCON_G00144150 [Conger conger]